MKKLLALVALAASLSVWGEPYRVVFPTEASMAGQKAYLINFDNEAVIDSTTVGPEAAVFNGDIDEPVLAFVRAGEGKSPDFILEGGTMSFSSGNGAPFGTMLNDRLKALGDSLQSLQQNFRRAAAEAERQDIYNSYNALLANTLKENTDNPLGYYIWLQTFPQDASLAQMQAEVAAHPEFSAYTRHNRYLETARVREATQPGKPFVDFSIEHAGLTQKLSDHVGRGHYTLVDFWASWCGPCIRELATLKDVYHRYKDRGLEVLGVAVWDEPADTEAAIRSHNIPWECIYGTGQIATDAYGITGIPCIILFGPDGTIIARGLRGEELKAKLAEIYR